MRDEDSTEESINEEYLEEELFPQTHRDSKLSRKIASRTDRSKYKKTDQNKLHREEKSSFLRASSDKGLKLGRVLSVAGLEMCVDSDGECFQCVLRGKFKKSRSRNKNLVVTGDFVAFEETSKGEGIIVQIEERKTLLSRADNSSRRKRQLLAANVDQVIITASVIIPPLKPFLVDRYIIAACKGGMKPLVVVNKIDLLKKDQLEREKCLEFVQAYSMIDIPVLLLSAETGEGIDCLIEKMKGKTSVFSGQSGVGKSSLISKVTGLDLKVRKVIEKTKKGAHTTTTTTLHPLHFGGWCVDTPGIGSFGLWDLEKEELDEYFEEILHVSSSCKFSNCMHIHEPGCAVMKAVEMGEISSLRFNSYRALIKSLSEKHQSR